MGTFSLRNQHGLEVDGLSLGGTITAIRTPDRTGRVGDIVLGMDTIEDYQRGTPFFGSIVGRYANRIAGARFELDGAEYRLTANEGKNQLHGGPEGFDKVDWTIGADATDKAVTLTHFSPDGDQGFPGDVHVEARFALGDDNALSIDFRATTSKPTHINLSHHCYFNLNGAGHGSIEDHKLTVNAAAYTPVNRSSIPTGEIRTVENTDFDFRSGAMIRPRLHSRDPQIAAAGGLDHNFILDNPNPQSLCHGATVYAPASGRLMELWTTEPGLQVYTGNGLDGTLSGKGARLERYGGLCLEPQHYPDTPNRPDFPSTVLRPGETFQSRMVLRFSTS